MILYHYTNKMFIDGIKKKGLIKGKTPYKGDHRIDFMDNHQWLTLDGNVDNQKWSNGITIPYNRNEYRVTVNIPKNREQCLYTIDYLMKYILCDRSIDNFNVYPEETKGWRVYIGVIPKQWIRSIRRVQ